MPRIALVTGAVTGIGAATARRLQSAGCTVIANHFGDEAEAEDFRRETGLPVRSWNVASFGDTQAAIAGIQQDFGPIDILVNNAGITRDGMLHKMSEEQWRSVIDTDLGGCFNTCRAVVGGMRERGFGRIVNVSSVNALSGQAGQTNYAAAKAGVIGFTKALALEVAGKGVTVNAIAPGYTDTRMVRAVPETILQGIVAGVPVHRLALPDEIARGVLFLAAEDAGFVTGATLSINGGKYMA